MFPAWVHAHTTTQTQVAEEAQASEVNLNCPCLPPIKKQTAEPT